MNKEEFEELRRVAFSVAREAGAADPELVADEAMERLVLGPVIPLQAKAWLRTVARRLAIDAHRRAQARPQTEAGGWPADWEEMRGPDHVPTPSLLTRRRLAVEEALEILSERERSLLLDWVDGWSWEELGERYGQSVPVLQTTLTRVKRKVREGFPDVDRFELD